jgi:hypothetical protein
MNCESHVNEENSTVMIQENIEDAPEKDMKENRGWIPYTIAGAVLCTICNSAYSEVSALGPEGILYIGLGPLLCGIGFFTYQMVQEKRKNGEYGVDFNFKDQNED